MTVCACEWLRVCVCGCLCVCICVVLDSVVVYCVALFCFVSCFCVVLCWVVVVLCLMLLWSSGEQWGLCEVSSDGVGGVGV